MDKNTKIVLKALATIEPVAEAKTVELLYEATSLTLKQVTSSLADLAAVGMANKVANGSGRFAYKYVISELGKQIAN